MFTEHCIFLRGEQCLVLLIELPIILKTDSKIALDLQRLAAAIYLYNSVITHNFDFCSVFRSGYVTCYSIFRNNFTN